MAVEVKKRIPCAVRVGHDGCRKSLNEIIVEREASYGEFWEFVCRECHQRWTRDDGGTAAGLDKIACSNCYCTRILAISVDLYFVKGEC